MEYFSHFPRYIALPIEFYCFHLQDCCLNTVSLFFIQITISMYTLVYVNLIMVRFIQIH